MTIETPSGPPGASNPAQRLGGVIIAPDPTLQQIAARPDWVVPLILILIVSLGSTLLVTPRIDFETSMREQFEDRGMSPQQIDEALEMMAKVQKFTLPITAAFVPILLLVIAAVLMLAFRVMGGEGPFKSAWAVTLYAWIPQLIKGILSTILIVRAGTVDLEEAQLILKSHLGFLSDPAESPGLFAFLSSIDIFNIWTVILLGIGFGYGQRTSRAKSFAIVVTLWVIVILGKVGLAALRGVGGAS